MRVSIMITQRLSLTVWLFILTLSPSFAEQAPKKKGPKHLNAKEAGALWISNKDAKDFIVLDVRRFTEYKAGHIDGATHADVLEDDFEKKVKKLDKSKRYLVHCRSGGRSRTALKKLQALGFEKLYHLDGGLLAWEKAKLPTVKSN